MDTVNHRICASNRIHTPGILVSWHLNCNKQRQVPMEIAFFFEMQRVLLDMASY
jgi:hypothetical protein